jgi:hypothetical protein
MTFKKDANSIIGHCQVNIKKDEMVLDYLFTEKGFEFLPDVLMEKCRLPKAEI